MLAYGYVYDAEGRRVAKGTITPSAWGQPPSCNLAMNGFTLTESYVLGQGGEELTTLTWSGSTSTWARTNVYGAGKLLATYDTAGLHFQLTDPLGTRRVQTNAAGEPELDCQSLPSGDGQYCYPDPNAQDAPDDSTPLHFTGKQHDNETSNDYFGARYYASSMGRFMSPDWSAQTMPVPYADLSNPQSLNLYEYAGNNPIRRTDPDGHFWQELGNLLKYNHYVNNAGVESALQGDADEARKNISGYTNMTVNGQTPANALKGLSNKDTVDLDRSITNFFESNMLSKPGTQIGLALATLGAEGIEAAFTTGSEGGFAALKTANTVGSALKTDIDHRAAFWMREAAADHGHVFTTQVQMESRELLFRYLEK